VDKGAARFGIGGGAPALPHRAAAVLRPPRGPAGPESPQHRALDRPNVAERRAAGEAEQRRRARLEIRGERGDVDVHADPDQRDDFAVRRGRGLDENAGELGAADHDVVGEAEEDGRARR
jgi:hypothetical protein